MSDEQIWSKVWYRSRGVWGSLMGVSGTAYGIWANFLPCGFWESFHGIASAGIGMLGALFAFVGRTNASQPIHFLWRYRVER